ncbi:hypothetical protein PCASD_03247 [Puccinia coronata f. sp. avenae]|uniref:Uncharacterized protein n=1 Tax=Puccinia coronata f. sp. avenae TaxID=200324 RepID=A0A2N5VFH3_9BASI|nr:hypothetical protein PCASD_03247 [Puccinia coronata f. sp. avenae]
MLAVDTTHQPGKPNAQLVMQKATGDDAPTSPSDRDSSDNEEAIPSPGLADTSSALDECGTPVEAATTLPAGSTPDPSPLPTGEPTFSLACRLTRILAHQSPQQMMFQASHPIVIALTTVNPLHHEPHPPVANQRTTLRQVPQQWLPESAAEGVLLLGLSQPSSSALDKPNTPLKTQSPAKTLGTGSMLDLEPPAGDTSLA